MPNCLLVLKNYVPRDASPGVKIQEILLFIEFKQQQQQKPLMPNMVNVKAL